jgi:hypothetical protein
MNKEFFHELRHEELAEMELSELNIDDLSSDQLRQLIIAKGMKLKDSKNSSWKTTGYASLKVTPTISFEEFKISFYAATMNLFESDDFSSVDCNSIWEIILLFKIDLKNKLNELCQSKEITNFLAMKELQKRKMTKTIQRKYRR